MKKFKIPIIIGLVVIVLVVVNLSFDLIDRIIVQFSSEKYAEYVSEMDYEEALLKEPIWHQRTGSLQKQSLIKS